MNRVRKPQPDEPLDGANAPNVRMSRTMQLAVSRVKFATAPRGNEPSTNVQRRGTWFSAPLATAPHTKAEQYWAARALVAETLLSAREQHQAEVIEVRRIEEQKREREINAILQANDRRQRRSERLTAVCLVILLGFMCWLVLMIAPDRDAKGKPSKPSHFTIPILSPFASVVEHETGVFGTKAVAIVVVAVGIASYVAVKHQVSRWHVR